MNSVAEKKKIISDFIRQCNDYADGQVRKYQARLEQAGANYTGINDLSKWLLCLAMLLGRLEIFTLLVLLTPTFWRG